MQIEARGGQLLERILTAVGHISEKFDVLGE